MDPALVAAARAPLGGVVHADWAAAALPLPLASFLPNLPQPGETDEARAAVAAFLSDSSGQYRVIFTAGATSAASLFVCRMPWRAGDALFCHPHVHNAVLGMRNVACVAGGAEWWSPETWKEWEDWVGGGHGEAARSPAEFIRNEKGQRAPFAVFAFPGECNLTGARYPLNWALVAKERGLPGFPGERVITLVDTAKLAASAPVYLDLHPYIDVLFFSLYKLAGAPTGLGALLVRRGSLAEHLLRSTASCSYFGGGRSVAAVSPRSLDLFRPPDSLTQQLEIGTPNFHAIAQVPAILQYIKSSLGGISMMSAHAEAIARTFTRDVQTALPPNAVIIHRDASPIVTNYGAIVSFTLRRPTGYIGHTEVGSALAASDIRVRTGCMCNAGACARVLGISDAELTRHFEAGHICGDGPDLIDGRPTGVTRVSFGWASKVEDSNRIVRVLRTLVFDSVQRRTGRGHSLVSELYIYPVKSCGGMRVQRVTARGDGGLWGDRVFGIVKDGASRVLTVRECPGLARIHASLRRDGRVLTLAGNGKSIHVGVDVGMSVDDGGSGKGVPCGGGNVKGLDDVGGDAVRQWLSEAIGKSARLVRLRSGTNVQGSVLVVTENDMAAVVSKSEGAFNLTDVRMCTRPNIVIGKVVEGEETGGALKWIRGCVRCRVVDIIGREHGAFGVLGAIARVGSGKTGGVLFGGLYKLAGELKLEGVVELQAPVVRSDEIYDIATAEVSR